MCSAHELFKYRKKYLSNLFFNILRMERVENEEVLKMQMTIIFKYLFVFEYLSSNIQID